LKIADEPGRPEVVLPFFNRYEFLHKQIEHLNPFVLREAMERQLRNILSLLLIHPLPNDPSGNIFL